MTCLKALAFLSASILILSGCVLSRNPFCSQDRVIEAPELSGDWSEIGGRQSDGNIWRIGKGKIMSFKGETCEGEYMVAFFKINGTLLADMEIYAKEPRHVLMKVSLSGDTLKFIPLNADWFARKNNDAAKNLTFEEHSVSVISSKAAWANKDEGKTGDDASPSPGFKERVYTCPTKNWTEFLEKNVGNPEIFSEKNAVVLKRASS